MIVLSRILPSPARRIPLGAACLAYLAWSCQAAATTVRGSAENLLCVHENRSSLSLDGLIDPVVVYIDGCVEQFSGETAVDRTHGGVDPPDFPIVDGTPPPEEWARIPSAQIDLIPCKLREALARDPGEEIVELDLGTPCGSDPT